MYMHMAGLKQGLQAVSTSVRPMLHSFLQCSMTVVVFQPPFMRLSPAEGRPLLPLADTAPAADSTPLPGVVTAPGSPGVGEGRLGGRVMSSLAACAPDMPGDVAAAPKVFCVAPEEETPGAEEEEHCLALGSWGAGLAPAAQ